MNAITLSVRDIRDKALASMSACVACMHAGDDRMSHYYYGEASVWEHFYNSLTDEWPEDGDKRVNKRYEKMLDEYCEHYLVSKR